MRLYYMTSLDVAIEHILPERRMRLARFDQLNDPFELMSASIAGNEERLVLKYLRDHWTKTLGVICMCKHWKSPLMWAHYARQHTGVCLGFDVPDEKPKQMHYEPERMKFLVDLDKPLRGVTVDLLEKVITTKYSQWAYEEEWRLFSKLEEKDVNNGFFYLPFGENLALREIIVGTRCTTSLGSFKRLIGSTDKSVTIIKARPAFETFTMVRQEKVSPIVVHPKK